MQEDMSVFEVPEEILQAAPPQDQQVPIPTIVPKLTAVKNSTIISRTPAMKEALKPSQEESLDIINTPAPSVLKVVLLPMPHGVAPKIAAHPSFVEQNLGGQAEQFGAVEQQGVEEEPAQDDASEIALARSERPRHDPAGSLAQGPTLEREQESTQEEVVLKLTAVKNGTMPHYEPARTMDNRVPEPVKDVIFQPQKIERVVPVKEAVVAPKNAPSPLTLSQREREWVRESDVTASVVALPRNNRESFTRRETTRLHLVRVPEVSRKEEARRLPRVEVLAMTGPRGYNPSRFTVLDEDPRAGIRLVVEERRAA